MGRQRYKPIRERRELVLKLAGLGVPQDQIAMLVKCSPKTLRKHFASELARGATEANAQVAGFLFQAAKNGNVSAAIFWLKTRARWKEPPHNAPDVYDPAAEQAQKDELAARIANLVDRNREADRVNAEDAEAKQRLEANQTEESKREATRMPDEAVASDIDE